ncbi:MAG: HEAT repeat domain-containing protein [Archangiaceae bacterium]|nr:HEAT repeat domain-containing protein [Archangiaceae bacterium]
MTRDWRAELQTLLLALEREKKPEDRADAANQLCELAVDVPVAARRELDAVMTRLLADAQPLVKSAGLALAAQLLEPAEAEALFTRHLCDPAPRVRAEAAGRLADLALSQSRGALAAALQDAHPPVRFEAARGLAAMGHPAGLDVLVSALDDDELRFRALSALAELRDPRALEPTRALFRRWLLPHFDRTQAAAVLVRLGDPAGEKHLLERAAKKWSEDRPMALELLGEVKAAAAQATLEAILNDPKDAFRGAAARGLGRLGTPDAVRALSAALATADDELKLDLAEGFLLIGTDEAKALAKGIVVQGPEARAELDALLGDS